MIRKYTYMIIATAALALSACEKEQESNWVDLRYDVPQDSYVIDAAGTQTVTIRVKSTDPWTVSGSNQEQWYTITPSSGEPGDIYTVVISCEPNEGLDDRRDTINVKSDYWTGKQFLLTQKGTAYLDCVVPQDIPQSGESVTLSVLSNQNWTAEVISGSKWLDITDGLSGNGDGTVMLEAAFNGGEQRQAEVCIYDRHGVPVQVITVTQAGVLLSPAIPDNDSYFVLYSESQQLKIPVESNADWTVKKATSEEQAWYDFDGATEFSGSGELVINVSEYMQGAGAAVRTGTLILSSVPHDDAEPVVKTIRFKQASPDVNRTTTAEGKTLDKDGLTSETGISAGRYTFHLAPFTSSDSIYLYFMWQRDGKSFAELRFWLNTSYAPMKTELSCLPYCNDVNKWQGNLLVPFDNTKPVKIALDIQESSPDADGNTWIYSEWWLNDVKIAHATSDGIVDRDGKTDNFKAQFSETIGTGYFRIWANAGSAVLEKWEYTSPIVWGE